MPAVLLMSVSIFFLYITRRHLLGDHPGRGACLPRRRRQRLYSSGRQRLRHRRPIVTGYIVQHTGKFDSAFVLAGGIAALGALLVLLVVRAPRPLAQPHTLKP
ncbi:Uncharacterised protein [Serratia rubidaea]|uniref:Uncharacterized protein n=1 Tax=Serratia rubidaea TaxID=61652 RepID=A0A4U9HTC4_SERRU|nr:Uncharacterised protein [Serratia rubidaea]